MRPDNCSAATPLIAVCLALSGCAVGRVGTLAANVQRSDTVSVLSVYSIGLHWRGRADDPGAHFGYSKRVYVFPADVSLTPGWSLLKVPSPAGSAFAQDLMTVGLNLSWSAPEAGLSLGYVDVQLLARLPVDACVRIDYAGSPLRIKHFQTSLEHSLCADP